MRSGGVSPPPPASYAISGTVLDSGAVALAGATLTLTGAAMSSAVTDANGAYTFAGVANGTYTVTSGKARLFFQSSISNHYSKWRQSLQTGFHRNAPDGLPHGDHHPAAAVTAGAQWQVDGCSWQNSGATVSGLTVGSHTLAFKTTISGWNTPASKTVTISNGVTTSESGAYVQVQQTGSLTVTITPAAAVTAGAQWQVDGCSWQNSGATVSGLTVGSHTLAFQNNYLRMEYAGN